MPKILLALLLSCCCGVLNAQLFADPCMTSPAVGTSFGTYPNMRGSNADAIQWTGVAWNGTWGLAGVTLPPPGGAIGARGVWMGDGSTWTTGGEGFGLRLLTPIVTGVTYSFSMSRVSHGHSSGGSFAPTLRTNTIGTNSGFTVGTIPAAGTSWLTGLISFTAAAGQNGHTWLYFHTQSCACGSGMFVGCPVVLPMELREFQGWPLSEGNHLEWKIRNDVGFTEHLLERSEDGTNFVRVASLNAKENTDEFLYEVIDESALDFPNQALTYRVRSLNENGESALSPIIEINRAHSQAVDFRLFPNPTPSGTSPTLEITSPVSGTLTYQLSDLSGRILQTNQLEVEMGRKAQPLSFGALAPGLYLLRISGIGQSRTIKWMVE